MQACQESAFRVALPLQSTKGGMQKIRPSDIGRHQLRSMYAYNMRLSTSKQIINRRAKNTPDNDDNIGQQETIVMATQVQQLKSCTMLTQNKTKQNKN